MRWYAPHPDVSIAASQIKRRERMRTKPLLETFAYGIDIGKKVFHVVAVNREGAVIQRAKFARDTLQSFFDLAPKTLIGMEACPVSQWLARNLI
jgi:transposase